MNIYGRNPTSHISKTFQVFHVSPNRPASLKLATFRVKVNVLPIRLPFQKGLEMCSLKNFYDGRWLNHPWMNKNMRKSNLIPFPQRFGWKTRNSWNHQLVWHHEHDDQLIQVVSEEFGVVSTPTRKKHISIKDILPITWKLLKKSTLWSPPSPLRRVWFQ